MPRSRACTSGAEISYDYFLISWLHVKKGKGQTNVRVCKKIIKRGINYLGFEITRKIPSGVDPLCEGFNNYLNESTKASMDVNDWIEERLGWEPALPLLNAVVIPYLEQTSRVCEIGPGTGRHARHILPLIRRGELHLFDHSSWIRDHLTTYFADWNNVHIHESDGTSIKLPSASVDLCFSNGTFIELKLGTILLYAEEFWRILKKDGHVIFDYLDISTEEGWQFLKAQSTVHHRTFTYHCGHTIDKVFSSAGFTTVERHQDGKSTYVVYRK